MADERSNTHTLSFIFDIFAILLFLSIIGFIGLNLANYLPVVSGQTNILSWMLSFTFIFIDNSLVFIFIAGLFFQLLASYLYPRRSRAFATLIGIFFIGYLNLVFLTIAPSIFGPLETNTILPITYAFFNSTYKIVIIYFFMIFSIILDLWGGKK